MNLRGIEVLVAQGDITEASVDAIVNAANNKLLMGGGVAGAIKKKGGRGIEDEAVKKGPIAIGGAAWTRAGSLKAKYVIHAATMGMDFKTDEATIRSACRSALAAADELKIASVALPALGCGTGGFPLLACAKIMAQEVYRYARGRNARLKEIIFCLYDREAFEVFEKGVTGYLAHVANELEKGPFVTVDAIIELPHTGPWQEQPIIIIERSNPPFGFALPGGFVDYEESLEHACAREAKEETGMGLTELRQMHTYSDPSRDPRFHSIGTVFIAKAKGTPKAGDDAAGVRVAALREIEKMNFAFDHKKILEDYIALKKGEASF